MLLLLISIFIFFAIFHLYNNWRIQPHSLYLSAALVFIALFITSHYLFISGTSVFWLAVFFGHCTPLHYLIGPMLFLYIRGVLTDSHALRRRDIWHFLLPFFDLITRIPYFLKPWSQKLWMAEEMVRDIRNLHVFANDFIPPSYIALPMRLTSVIVYTLYCLWMVWHFRRHYPGRNRVPIHAAKVPIRFLNYLLGVCLIAETCFLIPMVMFLGDKTISVSSIISSPLLLISFLGILSIPVLIQLHPEVLYGIPRWREKTGPIVDLQLAGSADAHMEEVSDAPSRPDEASKFHDLAERISRVLDEEKLYLKPDFSMEDLARIMDVPKHHLYYCFNHILNKRFTQLRAELRVQYACALIRTGASREKTLEAIGREAGFASRSSFVATFRDLIGMAPSEFQRSVEVNRPSIL
jgi:AraC-like DNA-binding protein